MKRAVLTAVVLSAMTMTSCTWTKPNAEKIYLLIDMYNDKLSSAETNIEKNTSDRALRNQDLVEIDRIIIDLNDAGCKDTICSGFH